MSQKVTIWIFFLLLVIMIKCDVTIAATNSSSVHSITLKDPIADTSKRIRMEFSHTLGGTFGQNKASVAFCGTHAAAETLMTNNDTQGFLIQHSCSSSGGCDPSSGNNILLQHSPSKF